MADIGDWFDKSFLLSNQIAIMNDGAIIQVSEPSWIFRKPNSKLVANSPGIGNLFQSTSVIKNGTASIDINGTRII